MLCLFALKIGSVQQSWLLDKCIFTLTNVQRRKDSPCFNKVAVPELNFSKQ